MYITPEDEMLDIIEAMEYRDSIVLIEDFNSGFKCTVSKYKYGVAFNVSEFGEKVLKEVANSPDEYLEKYDFILSSFFEQGFSEEDEKRIDEIVSATYDYLEVLTEVDPVDLGLTEEDFEGFAIDIEDMLYRKYGFATNHPLMDRNGNVIKNRFLSEV